MSDTKPTLINKVSMDKILQASDIADSVYVKPNWLFKIWVKRKIYEELKGCYELKVLCYQIFMILIYEQGSQEGMCKKNHNKKY